MTSIQCAAEGDGRLRVELLPRRRRRPHRRRSRGRSGSEPQASRGGDSSPQWHRKLPSSRPRATAPLRRGWSTPAGSTGGATASSWDQHRERIRFQKKNSLFSRIIFLRGGRVVFCRLWETICLVRLRPRMWREILWMDLVRQNLFFK